MQKGFAVAVTLVLLMAPFAWVQGANGDKGRNATYPEVKKILEDLGYQSKPHADPKDTRIEVYSPDGVFLCTLSIHNDGGTILIAGVWNKFKNEIALESINAWNIKTFHNRALLAEIKQADGNVAKVPQLESDLDVGGSGLSTKELNRFLHRYATNSRDFYRYLEKEKEKAPAAPAK